MAKILIVGNDQKVLNELYDVLKKTGHDVSQADTINEGVNKASKGNFDVVILDDGTVGVDGLEVLPELRGVASSPEVIVTTDDATPDEAETAVKEGVWDYIEKPHSLDAVKKPVDLAIQYREQKKTTMAPHRFKREGIIGRSERIQNSLELAAQAARSDVNVLLTGETGTGKELFAYAIHDNSHRADRKFVVVDCAALPENLVESTLFGHERGAFTGADKSQDGLIRQADGGTLFLDEVGEMPLSSQKSFLRVLHEQSYRPIGSKHEQKSNYRLISATNRNLTDMVGRGLFRKDLLFRIESFAIEIPALRDRTEDIIELTHAHVTKICARYGVQTKDFSPDFFETLGAYDWPGNVRELENILESAVAAARREPTLFAKHLPVQLRIKAARASIGPSADIVKFPDSNGDGLPLLKEYRTNAAAEAEQRYLVRLMEITRGKILQACEISGLSRARLYALLKKHSISR